LLGISYRGVWELHKPVKRYENGVIYDARLTVLIGEVVFVNYKHNLAFCKAFGDQVRRLRQEKGLSMREFALQADLEYSQLSKIERGVINTTISSAFNLAEALDVHVKELFDFKIVKSKK
jgi:DNA-binding XRE family transcriptional regulator